MKKFEDIVRDLAWVRSLTVPEIVGFGITVHKPDRIIIEPSSGGRVRRFPILEARFVDPSGYSEKLAEVRIVESLGSPRLYYARVSFVRRGQVREVPVPLTQSCEVRVDLGTVPLNVYLYLLAIADALRLPYVMWHRAYSMVANPGGRKTMFLVLLLNVLHELVKYIVELYEALVRVLQESSGFTSQVKLMIRSAVCEVLENVLLSNHTSSEVNNIVRSYLSLPDDFVLYAPTCEVCGRRIEGMLLPGELKQGAGFDDREVVNLEDVLYASTIVDALRKCGIPLLCRMCRIRLREKLSKLQETYGDKVSFEKLIKVALDEVRKEVRRLERQSV